MTTIERVVALQRVGLFAAVPGRTLAAVARRAREVDVPAGAVLIDEGAVEDHLFVLVSGSLRVHRDGRTLATLGPGATVGELAALVPEPRSATVTALAPSRLLRIDKPVLDEVLADGPDLATGVIAALVAMVRERSGRDGEPGPDAG
ncbi:MAG TPA: cyclic nucleotide-binding domain-containing protein [Candidatus Limnocylindrales bacterium]|jgi:CRP-like cAMP-binding protein